MQIKGTVIENTNQPFALIWSKYEDLRSIESRSAYLDLCQPYFENLPIVLLSEDGLGNLIYFGDTNLIHWLENQKYLSVQWESYSI